MKRHLILVGLPGAGKTTVGRLVAAELRVGFVDIDAVIVEQEALSIERIFAQRGEAAFRELEQAAMTRVLSGAPCVVAPGGGWVEHPESWDAAGQSLVVYLETDPATAAARAVPAGTRPLLQEGDPVRRMRDLLAAREALYRRAHLTVHTDGKSAAEIASQLATLARSRLGW